MNADDLLREAVSEAVEETLDDRRVNPEDEVHRLQTMVVTIFWDCYHTRRQERDDSGAYNPIEEEDQP